MKESKARPHIYSVPVHILRGLRTSQLYRQTIKKLSLSLVITSSISQLFITTTKYLKISAYRESYLGSQLRDFSAQLHDPITQYCDKAGCCRLTYWNELLISWLGSKRGRGMQFRCYLPLWKHIHGDLMKFHQASECGYRPPCSKIVGPNL